MNYNISDIKVCFGCEVCVSVCPVNAISMKTDKFGFLYSDVNSEICIECGKCRNVCNTVQDPQLHQKEPLSYFGMRIRDENNLKGSSSGGAFILLSDYVLSHGGVICGAVITDELTVKHVIAENITERDKIRGSKYLQSNIGEQYLKIKEELMSGRLVLFTGTPCQVSALYNFLGSSPKNKLITADLLCHGVPSIKIFADYTKWLSKKYGSINTYHFRDRRCGWHGSNTYVKFDNGLELFSSKEGNVFVSLYGRGFITRTSCYQCPFMTLKRTGDFTLGDFWGVERIADENVYKDGYSLLSLNTEKAAAIWEQCKNNAEYMEVDQKDCLQPSMYKPLIPNPLTWYFERDYFRKGFAYIAKRYANNGKLSEYYLLYLRGYEKLKRIMRNGK